MERRAIQLGLRRDIVESYSREWIVEIEDISGFVREQAAHAEKDGWSELVIPAHDPYPVTDPVVSARLEISPITQA